MKNNQVRYIIIIVYALIGNKSDLIENKEISEEEGRNFAKKIGAMFYLTSAKDGSNVNELFYDIGLKYAQKLSLNK